MHLLLKGFCFQITIVQDFYTAQGYFRLLQIYTENQKKMVMKKKKPTCTSLKAKGWM